jgi:ankyrin repeat protein
MKRSGPPLEQTLKKKTVTYHDEEGERKVIDVDVLFNLPLELQQSILLRVSPKKIGELCTIMTEYSVVLARTGEGLPPEVKALYDGICTNAAFWRAKLRNDFPFDVDTATRRAAEVWRREYIRLFKTAVDDAMSVMHPAPRYLIAKLIDRKEWRYSEYVTNQLKMGRLPDHVREESREEFVDASEYLKAKRYSIVRWYLTIGVDPNTLGEHDRTMLVAAVQFNRVDIARMLLEAGADVNVKHDGDKILRIAARLGYRGHQLTVEMLRLLIEYGAGVNERLRSKETPLIVAVTHVAIPAVRFLLSQGANPNLKDNKGNTALIYSAEHVDEVDMAQLLLESGAKVDLQNREGKTALMSASQNGRIDVVRLLLSHGADPDLVDKEGRTAMAYARGRRFMEIVRLLGGEERIGNETMPEW